MYAGCIRTEHRVPRYRGEGRPGRGDCQHRDPGLKPSRRVARGRAGCFLRLSQRLSAAPGERWLAVLRAGCTGGGGALATHHGGPPAGLRLAVAGYLRLDRARGRALVHRGRRLLAVDRADGAERDLRHRPDLLVLDLEIAGLVELEHPRDEVRREGLDPGVVVADVRVVE